MAVVNDDGHERREGRCVNAMAMRLSFGFDLGILPDQFQGLAVEIFQGLDAGRHGRTLVPHVM